MAIRLSVGDYCFSYYRNRRNHLLQKEKNSFNFSNLKYETYRDVYMDEIRHSPEHFLKEIEKEKQNLNRGHLKIFFGYATGVGKTYAS